MLYCSLEGEDFVLHELLYHLHLRKKNYKIFIILKWYFKKFNYLKFINFRVWSTILHPHPQGCRKHFYSTFPTIKMKISLKFYNVIGLQKFCITIGYIFFPPKISQLMCKYDGIYFSTVDFHHADLSIWSKKKFSFDEFCVIYFFKSKLIFLQIFPRLLKFLQNLDRQFRNILHSCSTPHNKPVTAILIGKWK